MTVYGEDLTAGAYVVWDVVDACPYVRVGYRQMCRAAYERAVLLRFYPAANEWHSRLTIVAVNAEAARLMRLHVADTPLPKRESDEKVRNGRYRKAAA